MADPGLLGITGCAGRGGGGRILLGVSGDFAPALPIGGLLGAGIGAAFLLAFAGRFPSGPSLILAGVAVSAIAAALLALALTLAPNPFALAEITFWLMGGLEDRSLWQVALAGVPILFGMVMLLRLGPGLDALSLGEDTARSLGVPVHRTLRLAAAGRVGGGRGCGGAGGIGFIGLVVPHCCAPGSASGPALCWPAAAGGGGAAAGGGHAGPGGAAGPAAVAAPRSGVLTALLGAPFLVAIARRVAP